MTTKKEVLDNCKIEGNKVFLPEVQLDRKLYVEVDKVLKGMGGKWNRNAKAHLFDEDPTELLGRVKAGEKVNLKKEFQFFETPENIADWLVEIAEIETWNTVLEPSAGKGASVDAIYKRHGNRHVSAIEFMGTNSKFLEEKYQTMDFYLFGTPNFLDINHKYDRIIANPPFNKNQDIDHIRHMYDCLEKTGRLVSIASTHWERSKNTKETEFRKWLDSVGAQVKNLPEGIFKVSGTMIRTKIIVIDKN